MPDEKFKAKYKFNEYEKNFRKIKENILSFDHKLKRDYSLKILSTIFSDKAAERKTSLLIEKKNSGESAYNSSKKIEGKSIYLIGGDYYWKIEFTQIYFLINQKRELIDVRKASLEPSFNFIKGPMDYFKFINETFFNNFFEQNKCFIGNYRISTNIYSLYYCENKEEIKKELKKNFININLLHRFLEKEFVLNYDDLFLEKNNKIYFLIIFDTSVRNNWIFGKPFL